MNTSKSYPTHNILTNLTTGITAKPLTLTAEMLLVTTTVILAIKYLNQILPASIAQLAGPTLLVAAAMGPTIIRRKNLIPIALSLNQWPKSLRLVGLTCLVAFPAALLGLWLLKQSGLTLPAPPTYSINTWISWILWQFLVVAVAEECFFRGYLLNNLMSLINKPNLRNSTIIVIVSALIFALAHILLENTILSALTFLPGLILGWLYLKTHSLLAPVLFHAASNIFLVLAMLILA
ncbi:MAG: CPBP family intramembrane metalloprotease [Planctomycetes bacterium]|nr:CPBP family intramembrane metalloprotease [Planctomycetota bacterium]